MIFSPTKPADHPGRGIDCEDALRPAFRRLVNQAEAAGWSAEEIESALLALANDNIMHALVVVDDRQRREAPASDAGPIDLLGEAKLGHAPNDNTRERAYA